MASTPNVQTETKVGGFKTFFAGEGVFVLKATAPSPGLLLIGAFGGIDREQLETLLQTVIDTVLQTAQTGQIGDGKVWSTPVDEVVRVRTGERGVEAL